MTYGVMRKSTDAERKYYLSGHEGNKVGSGQAVVPRSQCGPCELASGILPLWETSLTLVHHDAKVLAFSAAVVRKALNNSSLQIPLHGTVTRQTDRR